MRKSFARMLFGSLVLVGLVACGGEDERTLETNGDVINEVSAVVCEKLKECKALGEFTVKQCQDAARNLACTGQNGMPPAIDCNAKSTVDKAETNACLDGLEDLTCDLKDYPKGCPMINIPMMP